MAAKNFDDLEKKMQGRSAARTRGTADTIRMVDVDLVDPNPHQPRKHFGQADIESLSESIKQHGLIQPVILIEGEDGRYTLIAGERRLRAHKYADIDEIKAVVVSGDPNVRVQALLENVHRNDLSPLEEALALQEIYDATEDVTNQKELAGFVSRSYSHVRSLLAILKLSDVILARLMEEEHLLPIQVLERLSALDDSVAEKLFDDLCAGDMTKQQALEYIDRIVKPKAVPAKKNSTLPETFGWGRIKLGAKRAVIEIDRKGLDDNAFNALVKQVREMIEAKGE